MSSSISTRIPFDWQEDVTTHTHTPFKPAPSLQITGAATRLSTRPCVDWILPLAVPVGPTFLCQ